eukprot:gene34253-56991_t
MRPTRSVPGRSTTRCRRPGGRAIHRRSTCPRPPETFDLMNGFSASPGHGHDYSIEFVDAWAAVAPPPGWTPADTDRLRADPAMTRDDFVGGAPSTRWRLHCASLRSTSQEPEMPRLTPNLWFDTAALEAAEFYVSIFPNSRINHVSHYPEGGMREAGMVLTVEYELDGQPMTHINGGPQFTFDEALSLLIDCADQ